MVSLHADGTAGFNQTYDSYIETHKDINTPLISLAAYDNIWEKEDFVPSDLRSSEFELASVEDSDQFAAIFDI